MGSKGTPYAARGKNVCGKEGNQRANLSRISQKTSSEIEEGTRRGKKKNGRITRERLPKQEKKKKILCMALARTGREPRETEVRRGDFSFFRGEDPTGGKRGSLHSGDAAEKKRSLVE